MSNLWPTQINGNGIKTPATIMKEQTSVIARKTDHKVYAEVARADAYTPNNKGMFMYKLMFNSPARPRYSYRHFFIAYPLKFYPVQFYIADEQMHHELEFFLGKKIRGPILAESEEQLIAILDKILSSKETQKVITSMQAWSHDHL
jgi:hypothetical protein